MTILTILTDLDVLKFSSFLDFRFSRLSFAYKTTTKTGRKMRENSKLFNRVSDQFLRSRIPVSEAVYRGSFTVTEGDYLPAGVAQVGSYVHIEKSRFYQVQCIRTGSRKSQRPDFIGL